MKTLTFALAALVASAVADEQAAETCLRTKIWDGYNSGWAVRTATKTTLGQGEHRIYLVTLYSGNDYKIMACGDNSAANVDIVLYDALGNEVTKDGSNDREPLVNYKPTSTDTFYIAVHASKTSEATAKAGIATAVTYK
jgi:type 1 fimbria pilin